MTDCVSGRRLCVTFFLTHSPDMLANYYGERALAELRKLGDVRLNDAGQVL